MMSPKRASRQIGLKELDVSGRRFQCGMGERDKMSKRDKLTRRNRTRDLETSGHEARDALRLQIRKKMEEYLKRGTEKRQIFGGWGRQR